MFYLKGTRHWCFVLELKLRHLGCEDGQMVGAHWPLCVLLLPLLEDAMLGAADLAQPQLRPQSLT